MKYIFLIFQKRNLEEKNTQTDDVVIQNLSYNSNEDLFFEKDKLKLGDCMQGECRKRGGGFGIKFWPSDSEPDKRETRKTAWCEGESKVDSFRKMSEEDRSDIELDNAISSKIFSSLLEESLDLISEPIGRRKSSENLKITDEKSSQNENKCYVKYCYDRSKKYNQES